MKQAVLDRYNRLSRHVPQGPLTRRRDAPQRECVASAYTAIVVNHAATVAYAFHSERYASGFALVRPALEALLKQALLGGYDSDNDGWKTIADKRIKVTRHSLTELASRPGGPDLEPLWSGLSPWLNDFVHGGRGQLTSNPVNEDGWPAYPGDWFWTAMLIATIAMLSTCGWFWAHMGHGERAQTLLADMSAENWGTITVWRNGPPIRIVGPRH